MNLVWYLRFTDKYKLSPYCITLGPTYKRLHCDIRVFLKCSVHLRVNRNSGLLTFCFRFSRIFWIIFVHYWIPIFWLFGIVAPLPTHPHKTIILVLSLLDFGFLTFWITIFTHPQKIVIEKTRKIWPRLSPTGLCNIGSPISGNCLLQVVLFVTEHFNITINDFGAKKTVSCNRTREWNPV